MAIFDLYCPQNNYIDLIKITFREWLIEYVFVATFYKAIMLMGMLHVHDPIRIQESDLIAQVTIDCVLIVFEFWNKEDMTSNATFIHVLIQRELLRKKRFI